MIKFGQTAVEMPGIIAAYIGADQVYGIPSGYTRLAGIEYSANTYYEIVGFKLRGSDTVKLSFSVDKACNVFGCYTTNDAADNYSLYISSSSGSKYLRYDGNTYNSAISSANFGTRYDVVISPSGTSGMPTDSVITPETFTASVDMCIGTTSTGATSSKLDGKIWGDFVVVGRFRGVPVRRESDGKIGYYDVYSDVFYEPIGSNPTAIAV